jgi:organic radical activating enzyme
MIFYIDLVANCNLRCQGCPSAYFRKRSAEKMSLGLFGRVLAKIEAEYAVSNIGFFNWTEPLLHPDLEQFVGLTKQKNSRIVLSISSNLSLRNLEPLLKAIDRGLDYVTVSVSGYSQEVHSRYHVLGDIELVKANLGKVSRYISKGGYRTGVMVDFLRFNDNQAEEGLMARFCQDAGVQFRGKEAHYAKGVDDPVLLGRLNCRVDPAKRGQSIDLESPSPLYEAKNCEPCIQVFDMVALNHRAEVFLCCCRYNLDEYRVGPFLELSPEEILYRKVIHPECYHCRGLRRPATAQDFRQLQAALYKASRKDSAYVAPLLAGSLYAFPEYRQAVGGAATAKGGIRPSAALG